MDRMGDAIKELHQEHGLSEEVLQGTVLPSWVSWTLQQPGENGRRKPTMTELAVHDRESTTPRKAKHKLGKSKSKIQLAKFMDSQGHLPLVTIPPTQRDPFGGTEFRDMAKARVRSSQGKEAHARLRATSADTLREFPPNEYTPPARGGSREVHSARKTYMPSKHGRLFDHKSACTNLPPRWSAGEHARSTLYQRHSTALRLNMTWKAERLSREKGT